MKNRLIAEIARAKSASALIALLALPVATWGQVPVDENGELIGNVEALDAAPATGNEDIPLLSTVDLEELVGPIALYPDDLLAIVLPAAAYPLQIVDAARFIEDLKADPSLEPNPEWDDSVVALTNYPEVIELLNEDIDWTWRLGEAVVSQQADVVAAIETFRDRAYAAGNLKSDSYQNVSRDEGIIEITPIAEDVIYVPYYEPERVVVYQPRPAYYYYPRPYPVYYYPYSSAHAFNRGYFWGVTTAFTIGWYTDSLNVFHHSYRGHPYFGRSYRDRWWYRRPPINVYNNHYVGSGTTVTVNHYNRGDRWRARGDRHEYRSDRRYTRNRGYPVPRRQLRNSDSASSSTATNHANRRQVARSNTQRRQQNRERTREPIAFRERPRTQSINRGQRSERTNVQTRRVTPSRSDRQVRARTDNKRAQRRANEREHRQVTQQRRTVNSDRVVKQRRAEPTPKLRRAQPVTQARRNDVARQVKRTQSVTQNRRSSTPTNRSSRRAEPVKQVRRSSQRASQQQARRSSKPAPQQVKRSAPTRKTTRQEPKRQQKAAKKSSPAKKGRRATQRAASRQR
ncbi:MAG: DUF3300 domain-containing protein [Woeseiaceae bacterium]